MQCFLDTVYQWAIGGRGRHISRDTEIILRKALSLSDEGMMVEFDVTNNPTGTLVRIAGIFEATIHLYGINTNTGRLNHYHSIGTGYNDYYLLCHREHFEPLWPISD